MSEENENNNNNQEVDYKALYEKAQADIQALAAKKDEILTEAKRAKAAKADLEAKQKDALKDNGKFEELWQAEQQRAATFEKQLNEFKTEARNQALKNSAIQLANELAKGRPESAELLSTFVERSLAEHADELGKVNDSVLGTIKYEFQNDKKYAPLLGGSMATGGGAVGGKSGTASKSEIYRSDFLKMSPDAQMKFVKSDGKVINDN